MRLPEPLDRVLGCALDGQAPTREDCIYLLGFPAESLEAGAIRAVADTVSRGKFGNEAMLLGQIGIETAPCPGKCGFCVFGEGHTQFETTRLSMSEIAARARAFADRGDLYALFLMTMHTFEFENLLAVIDEARRCIPPQTQIVVNIGDFSLDQARALKSAGVHGAYHVCRLREGTDTSLSPTHAVRRSG